MVTDPARVRRTDPGNPDICPVYDFHKIYSQPAVIERVNRECRTAEIGCIDCKKLAADVMVAKLSPVWDARKTISNDPKQVQDIVEAGAERAKKASHQTLEEVKDSMKI